MRRGAINKGLVIGSYITTTGDQNLSPIIGINLGWDFVAEHEQGIENIQRTFGIPEKALHRDANKDHVDDDDYTVTKTSQNLRFFENIKGYAYLIHMDTTSLTDSQIIETFVRSIEGRNEWMETSWSDYDGGRFGIRIRRDALNIGPTLLGQIYEAFERCDVMIFLDGASKNPFARAGLTILIRSLTSK